MKLLFLRFYQFCLKQDRIILYPTAISLFLPLIILIFWAVNLPRLPYELPLFYSLPWGESQLATQIQFTILPSLSIAVTLTNLVILSQLHDSQKITKRILSSSSLVVSILLFISAIKIMFIFI